MVTKDIQYLTADKFPDVAFHFVVSVAMDTLTW